MKKQRRAGRPPWRHRRTLQSLALLAPMAVAAGLIVWLVVRPGGGEGEEQPAQYLVEPAAAFTLPTLVGDEVSLSDHVGRHNALILFNEGVGCAPCYRQIVDLENDWERFGALDVELISIMIDPISQLAPEAREFGVTGEKSIVAVDVDRSVLKAYDALQYSMHPGVKPGHTFVLVNKAGQIAWRWDWPSDMEMYLDVDFVYKGVSKSLKRAG